MNYNALAMISVVAAFMAIFLHYQAMAEVAFIFCGLAIAVVTKRK